MTHRYKFNAETSVSWRSIEEPYSQYEISDTAEVRSMKSTKTNKWGVARKISYIGNTGFVSLYNAEDKKSKTFTLQKLMANAWFGVPLKDKSRFAFKDENPRNLRRDNLEIFAEEDPVKLLKRRLKSKDVTIHHLRKKLKEYESLSNLIPTKR